MAAADSRRRDNLGVRRRVSPRDRLIVTAAGNLAVDDHNCTYRNLTGITRGSGLSQCH